MSPKHFAVIVLICLIWAVNTVLARIIVAGMELPPLFFALCRFIIVAAILLPWLRDVPRPFWRMVAVAMLISGVGFAMFIAGMRDATPSAAAIISQISVPATTLLSVFVLGEVIRWRRITGIVLTISGVVILMWRPEQMQATFGLWLIIASSLMAAVGVIMIKQMPRVGPLQYQAWSAVLSIPPLALLSFWLEAGQVTSAIEAGWRFVAAVVFMAIAVSIISHSLFFWVLQHNDANLVAPLMIMNPVFAVGLGIMITGDSFTLQMALGAALALAGVLIISLRPNMVLPFVNTVLDRFR